MSVRRKGVWPERVALLLAVLVLVHSASAGRDGRSEFDPAAPGPGVLRVATWNVGHGLDMGGGALPDEQVAHVVDVLDRLEVEGVVLQELRSREQAMRLLEELEAATGDSWTIAVAPGGSRRLALLVQGSFEAGIPTSGDGRTVSGVWRPESGGSCAIAGIHADAFSAEGRNAQVGRAVGALEKLRAKGAVRGELLLGDLNLDLDIGERGDLFTDDRHLDVETYNYACRRLVDAGADAGPTAEPDRRLDYVLVGGNLEVLQAGPVRGLRAPGMDHHPLLVDLETR